MHDPPATVLCCLSVRRSVYQVHGVLVSLARLVAYALIIGALGASPLAQVGGGGSVCVGVCMSGWVGVEGGRRFLSLCRIWGKEAGRVAGL